MTRGGESITGTCEYDVDSSDATAAVAEILQGKTAYVRGQKLTGTMKNNGAVTGTISAKDEEYTMTVLVKLVLRHQKKRNLFQTTFGKVLHCWV